MRRLIWDFAGRTYHNVGNHVSWLICLLVPYHMLSVICSLFLSFHLPVDVTSMPFVTMPFVGSAVVECLPWDRGVAGSSLTLCCSLRFYIICPLVSHHLHIVVTPSVYECHIISLFGVTSFGYGCHIIWLLASHHLPFGVTSFAYWCYIILILVSHHLPFGITSFAY